MNYNALGFSNARKILANCDKLSANSKSRVCHSEYGTFRLYKSNSRGRFYSLSGSKIFPNRGSLRISSIRKMLLGVNSPLLEKNFNKI